METLNAELNPWQRLRRSRAWRIPATGLGFVAFGVGAALLSVSVFPLMYFSPIDQSRKEQITRRVIAFTFRHYIKLLGLLGLLTYELHDVELLRRPNQLILVNHPSLLDVVFIIALTSNTSCVVKGNLWRNPFTIMAMRAGNYVSNAHSELFQSCINTLNSGSSLIIFPEGTRSKPGEPLSFHRGPSNIALSAGKAITPVIISCKPATLLKHQKWYQISESPPHFVIRVMPNFETAHYMADGQLQSTASRKLTRDLVDYFTRHIDN